MSAVGHRDQKHLISLKLELQVIVIVPAPGIGAGNQIQVFFKRSTYP